jgi:hypothetical protein
LFFKFFILTKANGNYALYLLRKKDGSGIARLLKAKELENDPEGFWASQYQLHTNGQKK